MLYRRFHRHLLIVAVVVSSSIGCKDPRPPTGGNYPPVTAEMLSGAQFSNHTGGDHFDDFKWTFSESTFEIITGKNGMPPDITAALLPNDVQADRISGDWSLKNQLIYFANIEADGKPTDQQTRTLRTMFTGVLRIQADRQYVFDRK